MSSVLPNLSENFLYQYVPPLVADLDTRGLMQAVVGGVQDRVADLRSYLGRFPDLINPAPEPLTCVLVRYRADPGGNVVPVTLDANADTPDDPAQLTAWAAAQLQVEESSIVSAVQGTDVLRVIDVDTVQMLADTLGAVLYPGVTGDTQAEIVRRRHQTLSAYFPRLRIKGTPQSFSIFARLAGFDGGLITPLWTRLSPRSPQDVGAPVNDGDFSAKPDLWPSPTLPDPAGLYDPAQATDGPFYAWTAGTLSPDPTSPQFYPAAVNGLNPFVSLNLVDPVGTVVNPPAGVYTLAGGASGRKAAAMLSSGTVRSNLAATAILEGDAFNGLRLVVSGTGSYRDLGITAQLSTVKYRSSYFDASLWKADAGTRAVTVNADLAGDPSLVPDGTAMAPFRPWSGGSAADVNVNLWPQRSVTVVGVANPRVQASGTLVELDAATLSSDAQRVYNMVDEVRAATRRPRRTNVGFLDRDDVGLAAYPCLAHILVPPGTGVYTGVINPAYYPAGEYTAAFGVITGGAETTLTAQSIAAGTVSFAGVGVSGTYRTDTGAWWASVSAGFSGTIVGRWSNPDPDTVRTEPTLQAKQAGTVCYTDVPEGTLSTALATANVWDDVPWMRMLRTGGDRVDVDCFIPFNDPDPSRQESQEARVPGASGVLQRGVVYDFVDVAHPPFMRLRDEPMAGQPYTTAYAYVNADPGPYPVVAVSPTTIVGAATWTPGRYSDTLLWWPLNEHPYQPLTPTPAAGPTEIQAAFNPADRQWDSERGWALTLSTGGTITGELGLPDQYSFAVTAKVKPGSNAGSQELTAVQVGAAHLSFVSGTANLAVLNGPNQTVTAALAMPAGTNTLVYVNVGTATTEFGLGTPTAWIGSTTLNAAPPRGTSGVRLAATSTPTQLHDLSVWGTLRTQRQLDVIRAPAPVATEVPVQHSYIGGVSGDKWGLRLLSSAFVVPDGTLTNPEVYPAGDVVRYEGTGRFVGNVAYKEVGLGGAQTLPARLTLGTVGPAVPATGKVVAAGTNGEPGYQASWSVAPGSIWSVSPPYTNTGGVTIATDIPTPDHWPMSVPRYNAATDRVYLPGNNGYAYQVGLDDVGAGVVFSVSIPLRPRPAQELSMVSPALRAGREVVTDFESRLTSYDQILAVNNGTVTTDPYAVGGFLLVETGEYLLTEQDLQIALEHDFDTAPLFLYLNSRVKSWAQDAFTRWVDPTPYGQALGLAARQEAGVLAFENTDVLPSGNYRLSVDAGNIGTVDDQFAGFNVDVLLTTGVGDPIAFSTTLLPSGTGTNPRGWTSVEFTLPYNVTGPWRLELSWTNDRDVPSRGEYRRLAIYAYTLRRVAAELYQVTVGPLQLLKVDVTDTNPLQGGAYVAAYNSYGTIVSYTHEQNLYATTQGTDTFNNPRSPLSDVLTGSTLQRRDQLDMPIPFQLINPSSPALPTAGSIAVSPVQPYYNVGDVVSLTNTGATGNNLRRTWHMWNTGTLSQYGTQLSAVVSHGGTLPINVDVVDDLGNTARAETSIVVNSPPSIQLAAASLAFAPAPYTTDLSAVIADADGDSYLATWYRLGTTPVAIGTGSTLAGYTVSETQTVRVYAIDSRGGTNFADVPLTASADAAPTVSIVAKQVEVATSPSTLPVVADSLRADASVVQILKLAAVARDPENKPITPQWTFWDGVTLTGDAQSMRVFGGGTYCTVQRQITGLRSGQSGVNDVGTKAITFAATSTGSTSRITDTIEVINNPPPVIVQKAISNPGVQAGVDLCYAASAFDPAGGEVGYTWITTAGTYYGANINIPTTGLAGRTIGGQLRVNNDFGAVAVTDIDSGIVAKYGLSPIAIDPAGGVTSQGVVVQITSPDTNVTIRYTLDGSEPFGVTDGQRYTGPLMVPYQSGVTVPINARAFSGSINTAPSALASATFIFTASTTS